MECLIQMNAKANVSESGLNFKYSHGTGHIDGCRQAVSPNTKYSSGFDLLPAIDVEILIECA